MWEDITSYSQTEKERKPRVWQLKLPGNLQLIVVWNHRDYPNEWIYHLRPWYSNVSLVLYEYDMVEAVKADALNRVIRQLEQTLVFAKEVAN